MRRRILITLAALVLGVVSGFVQAVHEVGRSHEFQEASTAGGEATIRLDDGDVAWIWLVRRGKPEQQRRPSAEIDVRGPHPSHPSIRRSTLPPAWRVDDASSATPLGTFTADEGGSYRVVVSPAPQGTVRIGVTDRGGATRVIARFVLATACFLAVVMIVGMITRRRRRRISRGG
jgi:hypothetical protein